MNIGEEIITQKGIATYLGDFGLFSAFVHVSPEPEGEITKWNSFDPLVEVFISDATEKSSFLGRVELSYIVDCAQSDGFVTADGKVSFSKNDCADIDEASWSVLSEKYKLAPTRLAL